MTIPTNDPESFRHRLGSAYYGAHIVDGGSAIHGRARSIASEFGPDHPNLPHAEIAGVALRALLDAPKPDKSKGYDPVKPDGLEIMAAAMGYDMPVYIWTVGDREGRDDPDNSIGSNDHQYQRVKIENSGLPERTAAMVVDGRKAEFSINTTAVSKESALREIFDEAERDVIKQVFIADDLGQNETIVKKLAAEYPAITVNFWLVKKDDDTSGNLAAYRDHVLPILKRNAEEGIKTAVVFDLDDTLIDTQGTLARAAELMRAELNRASSLPN